jgi:hypothetical protein
MEQDSVETVASRINPRFSRRYVVQNIRACKFLKVINGTVCCLILFRPFHQFPKPLLMVKTLKFATYNSQTLFA